MTLEVIIVFGIIVVISIMISYLAVYRGDWIQCRECETVFYPSITKALDKKTNTVYSDYAQGWVLRYCSNCKGYL